MGHLKIIQLENVQLENVTIQVEGLDPVLKSVDLDLPMDQTVLVKATDPSHAVHLLEILAGRREPQTGKVKWLNSGNSDEEIKAAPFFEVVSSYFESSRPDPNIEFKKLLAETGAKTAAIQMAVEHFGLEEIFHLKFCEGTYEAQKLVMLIASTLKAPQMLVLEDPAVGISETRFLDFLDWIQYWQRQGAIRHVFLTNNHPTAVRHFEHTTMFVDDGLVYVEDAPLYKKLVHF